MNQNLASILKLEVPIIVRLGERPMNLREVLEIVPGSIIELKKDSDAEIDLMVNNKVIGCGSAMKVGENFGIRIAYIGDLNERIAAMGSASASPAPDPAADLAASLLAGQG